MTSSIVCAISSVSPLLTASWKRLNVALLLVTWSVDMWLAPALFAVLADQEQVDVELHVPADRDATPRQLHLPVEAVLATVEARVELQARDLAEAALARCGVVTAGPDRARHAPDRELAFDLGSAVVGEANGRRVEADLGMLLGVEELRPEDARPHGGRLVHGDGLDACGPLERQPVAVAAQRRGDVRQRAAVPEDARVAHREGEGGGHGLGAVGAGEGLGCDGRHESSPESCSACSQV